MLPPTQVQPSSTPVSGKGGRGGVGKTPTDGLPGAGADIVPGLFSELDW